MRHGASRTGSAVGPGSGSRAGSRSVAAEKPINVAEQRIYHITHIDNLSAILHDGALLADTALQTRPSVDIASEHAREARRSTEIPGASATVASHVPFFVSPDAYVWDAIRSGTQDPRLSQAAYHGSPYDYVVLVTTIGGVLAALGVDAELVVADGDAAGPRTRFDSDARSRSLRAMLLADDPGDLLRAELLAYERVPFSAVTLVGVANHAQRSVVKDLLDLGGARPRVSVYPPWFQAAE